MHLANSPVGAFIAGRDYQLGAEGREDVLAFKGSAVRQTELNGVPYRRAHHRVRNPRIAAGRVNDGLARPQSATRQACSNHAQGRPVLHGPARVEPLGLGIKLDVWIFLADAL